ncbi:MAG: T9SS type A sorting domain-containing protein [Chitinophagales bacterium]|nr:T9SS type A sorting domain-containing protein [Chitinophagales bacterium]
MSLRTLTGLILSALIFICGTIDLNDLPDYNSQMVPSYILKDNTSGNFITNEGATLGRVLFYDKNLSVNNKVACASCHMQEFAFSDTALVSEGANDQTGRHSMRLINSRFADETRFFWDERAASLEEQTTMPIRDHGEMGFSGSNGDPGFSDLLEKLDEIDYYNELFFLVYGDTLITEARMQLALAQFIRSIQSFDSKYDIGRAQVNNDGAPFPNFTNNENAGKNLFITPPQFDSNGLRTAGGLGCGGCHRPPEFDIDTNSGSNGVILAVGGGQGNLDTFITRSPTLRDLLDPNGELNGPMMHNGQFNTIQGVIQHYNSLPAFIQNPTLALLLDPRLRPNGNPQQLNMTPQERGQLISFLQTLTGSDVYTNPKWSNPFDSSGNINITGGQFTSVYESEKTEVQIFPNPASSTLNLKGIDAKAYLRIFDNNGKMLGEWNASANRASINISSLKSGVYTLHVVDNSTRYFRFIKK